MRTALSIIVAFLTTPASAADLQQQLEAMARAHHGKVALYARHLKTGATVAIDADRPVQTASVIKLPIMVEAFAQVKAGKRSLDDKIVLREEDKVPGSGILQFLRPGAQITLEDAIVLMMIASDNTATNLVIDQVGIPAVNARAAAMKWKNTYLYKKVYRNAEGPMPEDQKQFGLGKTTAREMAAVLESIEACDLGDAKLCARMIEIMKHQQLREMIARYLETTDSTEVRSGVAAKLGELDDVKNEVALVYTETGPIVISIFTWDNQDQRWMADNEAYLLIARMAKAIVDAWAPKVAMSTASEGLGQPTASARKASQVPTSCSQGWRSSATWYNVILAEAGYASSPRSFPHGSHPAGTNSGRPGSSGSSRSTRSSASAGSACNAWQGGSAGRA